MLTKSHGTLISVVIRVAAIATALLMLTVLTVTRSQAAFSATTSNTGNSFAAGTVVLTDDDTGSAMFSITGMAPGTAETECIEVSYTGTLEPAPVRIYGTSTGSLDTYLDMTLEIGTGGVFGNCTGFSGSSIYSGTLASFAATHTAWATGLATWTAMSPVDPDDSRTFRFTFQVQDNDAAQGLSSTADFTFEAQG